MNENEEIEGWRSLETLRAISEYLGAEVNDSTLAAALEIEAKMRDGLLRLRQVQLSYVGEVIEPGHAQAWLEAKGAKSG